MRTVLPSPLLRGAFLLDAGISAGAGVLQLLSGAAAWLGLPAPLLTETGLFLLVYAAALVLLARSRVLWALLVQGVVIGNGVWALACVAVLPSGWLAPSALGTGWLLLQAVAVLVFAAAQALGLARSAAAPETAQLARS